VTGVDVSAEMLGRARASGPPDITYIQADVAGDLAWWDGRPFDGCTCEMALMDIDDLAGALSAVTAVLRPGGWFVASIVHPCLPGSERGASSWPPGEGYEREGWWTSPDHHSPEGVRIRVGATHRKLSTYLNALLDAGLEAERFTEPPAPVPTYLLWRCRLLVLFAVAADTRSALAGFSAAGYPCCAFAPGPGRGGDRGVARWEGRPRER
jgi:SAM-dependent methyltransferase